MPINTYVSTANTSVFDSGVESAGVTGRVGYDTNFNRKLVCRYRFTTDAYGASSLSFETNDCIYTVGGSSSSDQAGYRVRWDVTASDSTYKTYSGDKGYGYADVRSRSDQGEAIDTWYRGSANIKLMPNTTYYLWLFPNGGFPSHTTLTVGRVTIQTSGAYGTASTITAAGGVFGGNIPVTLSNSVNGVTNTLTVSCGGITKTLLSGSTAKSATWSPSLAEYGPAITNAKSAAATFSCVTKYGSATWGTKSKTITVSFPAAAGPEIESVTLTPWNSGSAAEGMSCYVQGHSKVRAAVTASAKYGASVSKYALTINGASVSGASSPVTSAAVTDSGTLTATLKVTDSRGLTASATREIAVEPCAPPALTNVRLLRCDAQGEADEAGAYLAACAEGLISALGGENSFTLSVSAMPAGGDYGPESAMLSGETLIVPGLDPDRTYTARITITDALGNSASAAETIPAQNWGIRFSVANGRVDACGVGKAPEEHQVLEIPADWELKRGAESARFACLSVSQLGLMSGSATIAAAWAALPDGGVLLADAADFASAELPAAAGSVEMTRYGDTRGRIAFYGRQGSHADFRMFLASGGGPTGTWLQSLTTGDLGGVLSTMLTVDAVTTGTISVAAAGNESGTLSAAKTGYTPVGIVGYRFPGTGSSNAALFRLYLSGSTINYSVRSVSGAISSTLVVYVLYRKNSY